MEHDLILNVYDPTLNYCDIYMLDYYGIMVFFEICDVCEETVKLVELATKPYKDGVILYDDLRLSKKPYFVRKNVFTKSDFEITPVENPEIRDEFLLPIEINFKSKIFIEVLKSGKHPITGVFFLNKVEEWRNHYFISNGGDFKDLFENEKESKIIN